MELQFDKTVIPCVRTVMRDTQVQEQTQDVRLPDGMPDIGKVLGSWGQVIVRGKEWHSSGVSVSGGVMAWVMYIPEDGTEPRCVEAWLPFQMNWDFKEPQSDGIICAKPLLRSIDSRSISARKLMVRSVVSMLMEAMVSGDAEIFNPGQLPDDVCILKNTYPVQMLIEAGEKAFTLEDSVTLPESQPPMEKLIRYQLQPELTEQKILADKIVFRGNANLHILYRGTDSRLYCWDFEIPFSQFGELNTEHSSDSTAKVCFAITNLEVEQAEGGVLNFKIGLTGQYVVYDCQLIEAVEDAYSPVRQVVPQGMKLQLPAVLDSVEHVVNVEQTVDADAAFVTDIAFYPDHPRVRKEQDAVTAELGGIFQMLYYDENDSIQCSNFRWEGDWSMRASQEAMVDMETACCGFCSGAVTGMNVRAQGCIKINATTWAQDGLPMVTGLEVGEVKELDPNRPSLILCRAGEEGLWNLAKRTGSTVEAIKKANNLESEPDSNKMLLIPV